MGESTKFDRISLMKATTNPNHRAARRKLAEAVLEDVPGLVDRLLAQSDTPGRTVEERSTTELLVSALAPVVLVENRQPSADGVALFEAICESQLRRGISTQAFTQGFLQMMREAWLTVLDGGSRLGIAPEVLLGVAINIIEVWTMGIRVMVTTSDRLAKEQARQDEQRRAVLLHDLLAGRGGGDICLALGLHADRRYHPLRARPSDPTNLAVLERTLVRSQAPDRPAVLGVVDGDLAGVVECRPELGDLDAIIGLGPASPPRALPSAFMLATRTLDAAIAFGRRGVLTLEDLGVRAAVLSEAHLGARFVDRYLGPLESAGEFGFLLRETLAAWFAHGMRMEQTARALHVHVNSLRYRLRRYETMTGINLGDTEARFELFWALEAEHAAEVTRSAASRVDSPMRQAQ